METKLLLFDFYAMNVFVVPQRTNPFSAASCLRYGNFFLEYFISVQ